MGKMQAMEEAARRERHGWRLGHRSPTDPRRFFAAFNPVRGDWSVMCSENGDVAVEVIS